MSILNMSECVLQDNPIYVNEVVHHPRCTVGRRTANLVANNLAVAKGDLKMKRFLAVASLVVLLTALGLPMSALAQDGTTGPQTYTVLVGYENKYTAIGIMGFFPSAVTIHAGDTVHFVINSQEIHTVSFGYPDNSTLPDLLVPAYTVGFPMPPDAPSPLVVSPVAVDQVPMGGGDFVPNANSGIMTLQEGGVRTFDLTFPETGDYLYVCLVHGWDMKGWVHVVDADVPIAAPYQASAMGRREIAAGQSQFARVKQAALDLVQPPTMNPDGSTTFHVMVGYHDGNIDLMQFFPDKLVVKQGDTVEWAIGPMDEAPHTVTFLNGTTAPELFIPFKVDDTVALYINEAVLFPSQPSAELTRTGFYSSGVLQPYLPPPNPPSVTTYTLPIGNMHPGLQPYLCLLHDDSGMTGTLMVTRR
jgi:plastocyanin